MASKTPQTMVFSSPSSLYPADNPGQLLVSHPLHGDNYASWKRAMRIALGAKNNKDLQETVFYANTARELWLDLEVRFAQGNGARIYELKRRVAVLRQESLSVSVANAQSEKVFQFLMGLNEVYGPIRTQILAMDPLPAPGKAYSLVLQEERHRGLCVP